MTSFSSTSATASRGLDRGRPRDGGTNQSETRAIVPEHSHESEQLTYVLTGALKFTLDVRDVTVRPGEGIRIPSWMPYSAEALEDTFELDLFRPIRQDWARGPTTTSGSDCPDGYFAAIASAIARRKR